MTENEAIRQIKEHLTIAGCEDLMCEVESLEMAIQALEEIQQYRAIGTVEDVVFHKKCYDEESYEYCGEYGTDTCGCKGRMKYLEDKIAEFEAIGTIEEFKALKEMTVTQMDIDTFRAYIDDCMDDVAFGNTDWNHSLALALKCMELHKT